jgi:hypothetical protein
MKDYDDSDSRKNSEKLYRERNRTIAEDAWRIFVIVGRPSKRYLRIF